jgi:enoyl-CoA hydratase
MGVGTPIVAATQGTTRVLTFDRPEARNAINREMRSLFWDLLSMADADDDIAAIVITGRDPAFSAGVDLKDLAETREQGPPRGLNPAAAVREVTTPVLAAVNGACVTGGLEVALSCDILIASERATFADTHVRHGLLPGKGMWGMSALLPDAVGLKMAKELTLTGRFVEADEAIRLGLVNHVVEHAQLLPYALELAGVIGAAPPGAVEAWLDIYDRGAGLDLEERLALIESIPRAPAAERR